MGVQRRAVIANELLEGGLNSATPVAVVEWASTDRNEPSQHPRRTGFARRRSPAVLVIGAVAALELGRITKFASSFAAELVMFPLVIDLSNQRVVVIGAGRVGVHKAAQLLESGALVT